MHPLPTRVGKSTGHGHTYRGRCSQAHRHQASSRSKCDSLCRYNPDHRSNFHCGTFRGHCSCSRKSGVRYSQGQSIPNCTSTFHHHKVRFHCSSPGIEGQTVQLSTAHLGYNPRQNNRSCIRIFHQYNHRGCCNRSGMGQHGRNLIPPIPRDIGTGLTNSSRYRYNLAASISLVRCSFHQSILVGKCTHFLRISR